MNEALGNILSIGIPKDRLSKHYWTVFHDAALCMVNYLHSRKRPHLFADVEATITATTPLSRTVYSFEA